MLELFIEVGKLVDIRHYWKKKVLTFATQLHCLFIILATHFSPPNRLIYRRKTKDDKNFTMWMLELFMDVDKLVDIRN